MLPPLLSASLQVRILIKSFHSFYTAVLVFLCTMQSNIVNLLVLSSDSALASHVSAMCVPGSPLYAIGRSNSALANGGKSFSDRKASAPAANAAIPKRTDGLSPAAQAASRIKQAAHLVTQAVVAATKTRSVNSHRAAIPAMKSRFSISRGLATPGNIDAPRSAGFVVLSLQPFQESSSGPRSGARSHRRGRVDAGEPLEKSAIQLRATILSYILEDTPANFPYVNPPSLLSAGGLTAGATSLQQPDSQSGLPSALYPRLAAILRLDTVAALIVFGRLFTASADAVTTAVWLAEGYPGVVARHRCVPGEWPALGAPAAEFDIRMQPPKSEPDSPSATPADSPPTLQMLICAIAEVAVGLAVSEASQVNPGSAAFRRGGGGVTSMYAQADALDMSASTASPRLGLLLLFIAFQIARVGPGIPPIVLETPNQAESSRISSGAKAIESAVRLAALYLCSPAPEGKHQSGVSGANSTNYPSTLDHSDWVLHDGVVEALISCTNKYVEPVLYYIPLLLSYILCIH